MALYAVIAALLVAAAILLLRRRKPVVGVEPTRRELDKAGHHVRRFTRALEQCDNPAKRKVLEANLSYWQGIRALARPE